MYLWVRMNIPKMSRYQYHIFVCENHRPPEDPKGCCAAKGTSEIITLLREQVKASGLQANVRVNSSGCLANCARGATIVVYPDAIWYSFVTKNDLIEIMNSHILNGKPVTRLMDPVFHANREPGLTA